MYLALSLGSGSKSRDLHFQTRGGREEAIGLQMRSHTEACTSGVSEAKEKERSPLRPKNRPAKAGRRQEVQNPLSQLLQLVGIYNVCREKNEAKYFLFKDL